VTKRRTPRSRSRSTASDPRSRPDPTPLDVAAGILRRAARTEAELEARLTAKGYQPTTAAAAVDRCRELGWVGDERLALDRARSLRLRGAGSLKIAADLGARGLAESLIDRAVDESLDGRSESEWARSALERAPVREGPRAWRLLASRGFPEDVITDVLGELEPF
jgi:regulatory protein